MSSARQLPWTTLFPGFLAALLLLSVALPAAAQNAYPESCFTPGPLPTFAASHVDGNPLFDYRAILQDATSPLAISSPVQIRAWRVPCHSNGSALLIRVTAQFGLPLAPQVFVEQGERVAQVRLASEARTLATDDSGRQLLLRADSSAILVVESNAATDAAQIDFNDALTLVIRDAQFERTLAFPAYVLSDFAVPQYQQISPGHSGSWFNRGRDGEGLMVEIAQGAGQQTVVVTWYTYLGGEQQWMIGSAPINPGDRQVNVPMTRTRGAQFGDGFQRADVQREDWGTLSLRFLNCLQLDLSYDGLDGSGNLALQRLTEIADLSC